MNMDWQKEAEKKFKENKKFLEKLKKNPPRNLDLRFHDAHDDVFSTFDCLSCANCCKTISPVFKSKDIERIADHLNMRPAEMVEKYLKIDEDQDYVLKSSPCPFLLPDNACSVYEYRPSACRSYPHTDRTNMQSLLNLTLQNTKSCPAALQIVEKIKNNS